jgi:hypothetical protein
LDREVIESGIDALSHRKDGQAVSTEVMMSEVGYNTLHLKTLHATASQSEEYINTIDDGYSPQYPSDVPNDISQSDMNSSNSRSTRKRKHRPMACANCRVRKLKVSKPFSKGLVLSCSLHLSVGHPSQPMATPVSAASKKDALVITLIKITFIMCILFFLQTNNPLLLQAHNTHSYSPQHLEGMYPATQYSIRPRSYLSRQTHFTRYSCTILRFTHICTLLLPELANLPVATSNLVAISLATHISLLMRLLLDNTTKGKNSSKSRN